MKDCINSIKYHLNSKDYQKFFAETKDCYTINNENVFELLIHIKTVKLEWLHNLAYGTKTVYNNHHNELLSWEHLLWCKSSTRAVLTLLLENVNFFLNSPIDAIVVSYLVNSSSLRYPRYLERKLMRFLEDRISSPEPIGLFKKMFCPFCSFCNGGSDDCLQGSVSKLLLLCYIN